MNKIALAAIVIIIVVIAILILGFPLGLYNGSSLTSMCIPTSGYSCTSPLLHNGTLTAMVGQSTGTSWTQANIFIVIAGSPNPTAVPPLPCAQGISTVTTSGQSISVSLSTYSNSNTCAGFPKTIGQTFSGTVWAGYRTSLNGTEQIVQIGMINVKAS
jgi:hypothetical protein